MLAHLGRKEEVSEIFEKYFAMCSGICTVEDETQLFEVSSYTLALESSVLVDHRQAAGLLLNIFKGTGLCTTCFVFPTGIIRHMGGAAALLGRYDEARIYFDEAIKVCT